MYSFFFFFQAEDGIRDLYVTGVQTCALPISRRSRPARPTPGGASRGPGRRARARLPGRREAPPGVGRAGRDRRGAARGPRGRVSPGRRGLPAPACPGARAPRRGGARRLLPLQRTRHAPRRLRPPPPARVSPRRRAEHAARERRAAGPGGAVGAPARGARLDRLRDGRVEDRPARRRGAPPRGEPALRGLARAGGAERRRLPVAPLRGGGDRRLSRGAALQGRAALPLAPPRRPPPLPRQPGALSPRAELLPLPRPRPRLRRLGARRSAAVARAGGRGGAAGAAAVDVALRAHAGGAAAAV